MSEEIKSQEIPHYTRMTGEVYDLIYSKKDYAGEAAKLTQLIHERCESGGNRVLEAACGTGTYAKLLSHDFSVDGFDLSPEQVAEAKKKLPDARIVQADMLDFDLDQQYDAVVCLFSSIGYLQTEENLERAVSNMARHTKPGGLVVIEPWLKAENFIEGKLSFESAQSNGDMSVARMGTVARDGKLTTLNLHHMVGTPQGVEHFTEDHTLAMYTDEDFESAYNKAGLQFEFDPDGLSGRGLYIGKKPLHVAEP